MSNATAPNTNNDRNSPQAEQNFTAVRYGTDKGNLKFGHIHKNADVTAGVGLYTPDGTHQLSLDISGQREGWTVSTSPGNFQVKCGVANTNTTDSMVLMAEKGNIVIQAKDGKIRFEANDIEMVARSKDGQGGNIKMTASETIETKSKKLMSNSAVMFRIATPALGQIIANGVLIQYASVIKGITDAVITKDCKNGGKNFAILNSVMGAATVVESLSGGD